MDTADIDAILGAEETSVDSFVGTFALDEFLERFGVDGFYCVNTAPSSSPGEHWLLLAMRDGVLSFFDSFGRQPTQFYEMWAGIASSASCPDIVEYNAETVQGVTTSVCGDYCVMVCLLMNEGLTLNESVNVLLSQKNQEKRDHAVRRMMIEWFSLDVQSQPWDKILVGMDNVHVSTHLA